MMFIETGLLRKLRKTFKVRSLWETFSIGNDKRSFDLPTHAYLSLEKCYLTKLDFLLKSWLLTLLIEKYSLSKLKNSIIDKIYLNNPSLEKVVD